MDGRRVASTRIVMDEPSKTVQSDANDCDINCIVERAKRGIIPPGVGTKVPIYGDFTNLPTFVEAMRIVALGRQAFESLDAFIRERFGNDPANMIRFLDDPANRDEAVKLGLVKAPEVPVVEPVAPVVPPVEAAVVPKAGASRGRRSD